MFRDLAQSKETEYQNVDKWLIDGRHKNQDDLNEKKMQLRQLKTDLLEIIQLKQITDDQIQRIFDLVRNGKSGVWETVTIELERLAFHFDEIKYKLKTELKDKESDYVSRLITTINVSFDRDEIRKISSELMEHKSKKVRECLLTKIFDLRLIDLKADLLKQKKKEKTKLRDQIDFVINNIDQPKGTLGTAR